MSDEYVYAVGHPHGYVKIGRSNHPQRRLSQIQTNSPYELWLIVQLPVSDSRKIESELHDELDDKRFAGEWFELDYDDYDMLIELMKMTNSNQTFDSLESYRTYRRRCREYVIT